MAIQAYRNECRTTTVCVDSYVDGVPKGRFFNPYFDQWIPFLSLTQFLTKMQHSMDEMAFPRSFTEIRSFASVTSPPAVQTDGHLFQGKRATFAIRILYRQNTSWQGSVTWLEGHREESFRSVLELILLMDSALTGDNAE